MISVVRMFLCILFLQLFFGTGTAWCQDFFMGKVLAVDPDRMEIEVDPLSTGSEAVTGSDRETVLVRIAEKNNLPMRDGTLFFPRCVAVGERIRLWGKRGGNGGCFFTATDIRGCRGDGCSDPTGVRSRLWLGRKHKQRHRNMDNSLNRDSGAHGANHGDLSGKGYGRWRENGGGGEDN